MWMVRTKIAVNALTAVQHPLSVPLPPTVYTLLNLMVYIPTELLSIYWKSVGSSFSSV